MICAENLPGLSWTPKSGISQQCGVVAERSHLAEAGPVRAGGRMRSENVGISSKNGSENLPRRKPKVSWATKIVPGLVGPKARPKGVVDGQLVNIPALPYVFDGVTHFSNLSDFRL